MTARVLVRGACPTLAAPMRTGDGWLARLAVAEMTGPQLAGLAEAAARLGNGIVEVTARGSLQVRGLTPETAAALGAELAALGIAVAEGLPVLVGPLAGLDRGEVADPRPVAAALRARARGLALRPKVAAVVDGGGALHLDGVPADLRLVAGADGWRVIVGDAWSPGAFAADEAVAIAGALLAAMAARGLRGRDLPPAGAPVALRPAAETVGPVGGGAHGFGLPFGQADTGTLTALAVSLGAARVRLAPGRALVVPEADARLVAAAQRLGFILAADDPRRRVAACAGAPACDKAHLPTRALASRLTGIAGGWTLHLSGCEKRCAQPAGPAVTVVGTAAGWDMTGDGMAMPDGVRDRLAAVLGRCG